MDHHHHMSRRQLLRSGAVAAAGMWAAGLGGTAGASPSGASAPAAPEEGVGPFKRMVIRGATLIDGTGAPPRGPVDIVVAGNQISQIMPVRDSDLGKARPPYNADYELDATGMFVTPGFIDLHVHAGGPPKNPLRYPYKLWLAHGVTTVRGVALASNADSVSEKALSARNEIVAPRIVNFQLPASGWDQGPVVDADSARAWVRWGKDNGVDGVKIRTGDVMRPDIMAALMDEARKLDMGTTAHLDQRGVLQTNAIQGARLGLRNVEHFYGHFESLLRPGEQLFPDDYDYSNEQVRFSQVADWINKIYPVGGPQWRAYLDEHLQRGTVFDPTFNIYVASRDVVRMRTAEWHETYTLPSLWEFFRPSNAAHGSYYWDWGTEVETAWKIFYEVWFQLVHDYHDMGGRITTGTDSGFIYQTYGFAYVEELEMLRESGLDPLEILRAATMDGAKTLYEPLGIDNPPVGTVAHGKLADLVVTPADPTTDLSVDAWARRGGGFKTLYGTGHERLNPDTKQIERVGGIRWTIKDGIVYDARGLLADVAADVAKAKAESGST